MSAHVKHAGVALERYLRHWRERGALMHSPVKKKTRTPITITISKECGVGGTDIAQALAKELDWPVYDSELVEMISEDTGVQSQLLDSLDEKAPHWLAESFAAFSSEKNISGSGYAKHLLKVLLAIHGHGDSVVVGRGAAHVLPARSTLRVRLIAPLEERVEYVQQKTDMDAEQARKHIEAVDCEREAFVKGYFQKTVSDPHGYDVMLNPLALGKEATVDLILHAKVVFAAEQES